jgi:hypothetical protein
MGKYNSNAAHKECDHAKWQITFHTPPPPQKKKITDQRNFLMQHLTSNDEVLCYEFCNVMMDYLCARVNKHTGGDLVNAPLARRETWHCFLIRYCAVTHSQHPWTHSCLITESPERVHFLATEFTKSNPLQFCLWGYSRMKFIFATVSIIHPSINTNMLAGNLEVVECYCHYVPQIYVMSD